MSDADWPVLETVVEYDTGWFRAGYDRVERPDGERAKYYWVEPPDAVVIVAVSDDRLVMVEEYRPRQRARLLTCPAGAVDEGESPTEAAVRELREETGFRAGDLRLLDRYHPSGWLRQEMAVVAAADLEPGEQSLDAGEFIDVRALPVDEALAGVREPAVSGWSLTALLVAREAGVI